MESTLICGVKFSAWLNPVAIDSAMRRASSVISALIRQKSRSVSAIVSAAAATTQPRTPRQPNFLPFLGFSESGSGIRAGHGEKRARTVC